MDNLLTCGHPPTPQKPGSCGTGYGKLFIREDADGKVYETRCYACCAKYTRERMVAVGHADLYLVSRDVPASYGSGVSHQHYVTDWTGELSFRVIGSPNKKRNGGGFGAQRTDAWFNGPDGYVWHAINRGDNDIARCRRTKQRT